MVYRHNNTLLQGKGGTKWITIKKEIYVQDKVWEDIMQTDKLFKNYVIL